MSGHGDRTDRRGDEELRSLEREILLDAAALDARRRHAHALLRAGDEERGLAALDLAWRLGADELWDDLRARLAARAIRTPTLELRYVPGGPFVMGADDLDEDARPAHLVHLAPFYVATTPLTYGALEPWQEIYVFRLPDESYRVAVRPQPFVAWRHQLALAAVAFLASNEKLGGRAGKWSLISEAQWERVFRASLFRKDLANPYGCTTDSDRPEWMLDDYDPSAYAAGARRDPVVMSARTGYYSVRGVPGLPAPVSALYREAADENGRFELERGIFFGKTARHEAGLVARPVFVPASATP